MCIRDRDRYISGFLVSPMALNTALPKLYKARAGTVSYTHLKLTVKKGTSMIFKHAKLGMAKLDNQELVEDRKSCKKIGPCGVGKKALYLNSFYIGLLYTSHSPGPGSPAGTGGCDPDLLAEAAQAVWAV